jgi:hypothetical protein
MYTAEIPRANHIKDFFRKNEEEVCSLMDNRPNPALDPSFRQSGACCLKRHAVELRKTNIHAYSHTCKKPPIWLSHDVDWQNRKWFFPQEHACSTCPQYLRRNMHLRANTIGALKARKVPFVERECY